MNIRDFLSVKDVAIDVAVSDKQKLLLELASKAGARLRLEPEHILAELSKREQLGSTGVGDGVAIPHARFSEIEKTFGCFFVFESRSISMLWTGNESTWCSCSCFQKAVKVSN